ncbi:hypothetical protein [Galbibacter mesophilus]|uniref:hypothetical protein n=1 Tax=Galbibacter mesophilus TaxID=379069 RepID=UPI00191F5C8D|nr:hypothetical protein [Galbibacter mesophilus]MCM5663814.1 hypothetical protein [Galbibacter mesophilus]
MPMFANSKAFIAFILIITLTACKKGETSYYSKNQASFTINFSDEETVQKLLQDSILYGSDCAVAFKTVGELPALEVKTKAEFSDAFIDFEKLFGHTIDFSQSSYLTVKMYVPKNSWISALKFNFKDAKGNFGGGQEVFNNFYQNENQWIEMTVDMKDIAAEFQNWSGDENPLPQTQLLSLNPYNAHQADSSSIYIHSLKLTQQKPEGNFVPRLAERVELENNIPYEINFDDEATLKKHIAYRSYESSYQALAKNVAGNPSRAIRVKGNDTNKYIAFLPIMDKVTGKPVDFTKVKTLYFSYYITPDSDDFDGSWLYLTSEHWNDILQDTTFYLDYKKGSWQKVSIPIDSLHLQQVKGDRHVLPEVYELRLDLNYYPGKNNIEMWIDNFGWK